MSFTNKLSALIPFSKKEEVREYFFALNIAAGKLTAALWMIEKGELKILDIATEPYNSLDQLLEITDKLLDQVVGVKEIEPQKILFGVPNTWLSDDNLKDEYLKLLKKTVKELELTPMAYVATSHAVVHLLEKEDGVPPTAILVDFEQHHLAVTVVRAGKIDGVKILTRGDSSGVDIEKVLLAFTDVETLPSKILTYGLDKESLEKLKTQLLSFPWMSKLSFLHLPKIEILKEDLEIKSICLAGASELDPKVSYNDKHSQHAPKSNIVNPALEDPEVEINKEKEIEGNLGFMVGDVSKEKEETSEPNLETPKEALDNLEETDFQEASDYKPEFEDNVTDTLLQGQTSTEIEDFQTQDMAVPMQSGIVRKKFDLKRFIPKRSFGSLVIIFAVIGSLALVLGSYLFLFKANVKVFVEPKILEKEAQITADPTQKEVDEEGKIIPGQVVDTEVSGSAKDQASGKREVGESAKGTVVIRNKTDEAITLSKGAVLTAKSQKFTLDTSVTIASRSGDDGTWGKANGNITASGIGADGNLPSGTDLTISSLSADKAVAKAEGNFSGGTSKQVTVVSSEDQKRLLASLASQLRQDAQQKLQEKLPDKKVLQEALSENIVSKSYNKNINDQANEFSLNMTIRFKGTAFEDKDLRLIVSKLVTTQVPDGFHLDLSDTETQADVSKLEKDGKVIFLAKFKAKLLPKIDTEKIKNDIKFKSPAEVEQILKGMENVLGSEVKITPSLPSFLQRIPLLSKNITVEVGLK